MKNRKLFFIIVLTFSIFCFVGCGEGNLSAYAYISDLISAVDSEENEMYYVQATVSIKDFTNESAIEFLSQNINSFSNARQERITDYSTAFVFDIKIPVLNKENLYKLNSYDVAFIVASKKDGKYVFELKYNEREKQRIYNYAERNYYSFDLNNIKIDFTIDNDDRCEYKIETSSVYCNAEPYPYDFFTTLSRREKVKIIPSDVLHRSISLGREPFSFCIYK